MRNLLSESVRRGVEARLRTLEPETLPLWGKMNAAEMLAHCSGHLRMSFGEISSGERRSVLGRFPIKQLLVYLAPWPKGAPTVPELVRPGAAESWDAEIDQLSALVERFPGAIASGSARHPLFGKLSRRAWGRLAYRHLDHHLRQFGV